ncbi:MAG: FAD-dependent oxidoreductase [Bacteroidia bacterium]
MAERKSIIFAIDDEPEVLKSVRRDLRNQYKDTYRIMSSTSASEALEALAELKKRGETVALFVSDQRMPEMLGVEFLEEAMSLYPEAKRVLLTAYSDIDAAIKAINDVQLDYYLLKPWDPPVEKLYPVLSELLDDWQAGHRPDFQGIKLLGYQYSPKSHALKDFLAGNLRPYMWMDIDKHPEAEALLELHKAERKDLPLIVFQDGEALTDPALAEVATRINLSPEAKEDMYDVVIIGAGPAGLAAGVYGGSEGLNTLLVERRAPGGQAGTSSRIENYLGFPSGLSGAELSRRAITQAKRFGVEFLSPQSVTNIETQGSYKHIQLADGSTVNTKAVIITTGVDYRKLQAPGLDEFSGKGVYYGAAMTEANSCKDQIVYVVGGGNSAGQGAVYLSKFAKEVHILIRKPDLTATMSSYLIDQIDAIPNITVQGRQQVKAALGEDHLECLEIERMDSKEVYKTSAHALFIFIGAKPMTDWMGDSLIRNERGFILTGNDLSNHTNYEKVWNLDRKPFMLETCVPGIFAAGDVRANAMNRVASAVGEGAMAIKFVHEYLADN